MSDKSAEAEAERIHHAKMASYSEPAEHKDDVVVPVETPRDFEVNEQNIQEKDEKTVPTTPTPDVATSTTQNKAQAKAPLQVGVRSVKMTISRIDPWSALKISLLLSVALGIMIVVATIVLWLLLDAMHVWAGVDNLLTTLNQEQLLKLGQLLEFGRVVPFSVIIAVIEVVLFTVFGVIGSLIYNLVSMLVGGLHITVTDE